MSDENYDPLSEFLAAERQALGADAEQFQQSHSPAPASAPAPAAPAAPAAAEAMDVDASMFVPPEAPMSPPETYAQAATSQTTMEEQYSSLKIASPSATPEASEFQKEWQSKNQGLIEQRDRQSQGRHEEVVAEAKEAMDKFYAEYNERRDRAVKENRNSQEIEVQSASKGNLWERVWKQIDLATRAAVPQESLKKTQAGGLGASPFAQRPAATQLQPQQPQQQQQVGSRDTSRMRELLQDLKRDENAPGVKPRKTESAA